MMKLFGLILLLSIGSSLQASTPSSPSYVAGVVEFSPERKNAPSAEILASNLKEYLDIMTNAPSNLDIIVFPEMTMNGMLTAVETPEPSDRVSPCDNATYSDENILKKFSCSAKSFQRYVVVNIVTKAKCPDSDMIAFEDPRNCSARADGMSYYNTNIVFDRSGAIISRYRKFNLFGESVDKPHRPSMITFETDFGVTFGHFVCFDLMFRRPALELVRNQSITDIVFTTMWFSEAPFLTAVQVQQNWAYSLNVNLLASGANNPGVGSTGTGIYAGKRGSLISTMEGEFKTQLHVATVPKISLGDSVVTTEDAVRYSPLQLKPLKLKRDQLERYNISYLSDVATVHNNVITECSDDICCTFKINFEITASDKPSYKYATAVYHGNRTFDGFADGGVVACAIIACQTSDIATCAVRNETYEFNHKWNSIEISGSFPYGDQFFYLPTTLDSSVMPFRVSEFNYNEQKSFHNNATGNYLTSNNITITSVGNVRDFYAFGIYGRDFNLDDDENSGAGLLNKSILLVCILALIAVLRNLIQ